MRSGRPGMPQVAAAFMVGLPFWRRAARGWRDGALSVRRPPIHDRTHGRQAQGVRRASGQVGEEVATGDDGEWAADAGQEGAGLLSPLKRKGRLERQTRGRSTIAFELATGGLESALDLDALPSGL